MVDRARGAGLVVLVVLALVAGAGWWRDAVPGGATGTDGPGAGQPAADSRRAGESSRSRAVDPVTGAAAAGASRIVVVEPRTGGVIVQFDGDRGPYGDLARFVDPLWEARLVVRPGQPPQRRAVTPAGPRTHLLRYRCVGAGRLLLVTVRSGRAENRRVTCDGRADTISLRRLTDPIRVELAADAGGPPVVADVRLWALGV